MTCVQSGFTINNDVDGKLKKRVERAASSTGCLDFTKATILAGYLNNDSKFIQFLKEKLIEDGKEFTSLIDTNGNTLIGALNEYYKQQHISVENTISKQQVDTLNGFTNANAKYEAIEHTADQILKVYDTEISKPKNERLSYVDILNQVKSNMKGYLYREVVPNLIEVLNTDDYKNNSVAKTLLEDYNNRRLEVQKAQKDYNNACDDYSISDEEFENLQKDLEDKKANYYAAISNIINDYEKATGINNGAFKNYLNLVNLITGSNKWFYTAFTSSKLTDLVKDFEAVLEDDKLKNDNSFDELDWMNTDENTIDETAKNWENSLYSTFTKHVNGKLKFYFSRLYNLASTEPIINDKTGVKEYPKAKTIDLGVAMTMHPAYCIAQICANVNFNSIKEFIDGVEELAKSNPKLYGLMQFVEDMRNDTTLQFAKEAFTQLHNPKIQKLMVVLNENGVDVINSNKATDKLTLLIYNMINASKSTVKTKYYNEHQEQIKRLKRLLPTDSGRLADRFKKESPLTKEYFDVINDLINLHFPIIDKQTIRNYIYNTKEEEIGQNILNILTQLDTYLERVKEYNNEDYQTRTFDKLNGPIVNIAKTLLNYTHVNVELNSTNAEGNMSSDLMKNSYITNLIEQINYEDADGNPVGLQNLGNFLAQGEQFKYNPIIFGIRDTAGNVIQEGMFTIQLDGTVKVNPNAKDLIQFHLFDGTKNQNDGNGTMYTGFSKGDYFLTSLYCFNNPIDPSEKHSKDKDSFKRNYGGFFLRTPSDSPKNFIIQTRKYDSTDKAIKLSLYNHLYGELNNFVENLNHVFEFKDNKWISKTNTDLLIDRAHYNGTIVKDGKLSSNFFKFLKLFNTSNYNTSNQIEQMLSLYGVDNALLTKGETEDTLILNPTNVDYIDIQDNNIKLKVNENLINNLQTIVNNWINSFSNDIISFASQYNELTTGKFSNEDIINAMLNSAIVNMSLDDLLEGDVKYYKNAQDFLKRAKEIQAGGKSYGNYRLSDPIGGSIYNYTDLNNNEYTIKVGDRDTGIKVKNGFRAVTISNTVRPSDYALDIKNELNNILIDKVGKERAEKISKEIAAGYFDKTKTNDAQSYITFEEWLARKEADGTINEYKDIIEQIYEVREGKKDVSEIDLKGIINRIQIQKNFYFDKQYDINTRSFYPRQIKNAEFVIIPELVKGTDLEVLYNIMRKYDIGQVNTAETDKAAKRSVLKFWDNDGVANAEEFENALQNDKFVENYYYRYLYKQQDVPQHLVDEKNKAGIQIMKKILDNANNEVKSYIDSLMANYVANIKNDFRTLLSRMGWKTNESGQIVNASNGSYVLDFNEFYYRARIEAQRLGLDSNFIEYLTPTELGNPKMPNYMNHVASKIESIAQSIFTNAITRQTLPGWHAAQVTAVGHGVLDSKGEIRKLKYHPKVTDENGNVKQEAYAEVLIPRWSNLIPKDYDISKLESEGLDIHIGYRIPTEGKQSVSVLKVVGFLDDIYGSTIMVPDEWVTQTGSDFDVDSVYGISYSMHKDKDGILHKIEIDKDNSIEAVERRYCDYINSQLDKKIHKQQITDEFIKDDNKNLYNLLQSKRELARREYVNEVKTAAKKSNLVSFEEFSQWDILEQQSSAARNNAILDAMKSIMEHENSREENYSRSNFDDLTNALNKVKNIINSSKSETSAYNPIDQMQFFENAVSGRKLKAFSVTRDTFNSICNYTKAELGEDSEISVIYDLNTGNYDIDNLKEAFNINDDDIDTNTNTVKVKHSRIGNSLNNRNVVGKLLTPYSSQTTAHILDAIKEGTIPNENEYTFGTFKTLIDVGIDYDTAIAFLMQPAITRIVDAYNANNSVYTDSIGNPINAAIKNIAKDLGITINKKEITPYTNTSDIWNAINANEELKKAFSATFGAEFDTNKPINEQVFSINSKLLYRRLKLNTISNNSANNSKETIYNIAAFDLATVLTFNRIHKITQNIESIANCLKPDSFGAKQTIHSTRRVYENAVKYITDENQSIAQTIKVGDKDIISAIYPNIENDDIDVSKSAYPYLAAFFKYATQASVKVNSQLFKTESPQFVDITNAIEVKLGGKRLSEEEYKELKQYMIQHVYRSVPLLTTPITLNKFGYITYDTERIKQIVEKDKLDVDINTATDEQILTEFINKNYWDAEKYRIFGYTSTESVDLEVQNINKPTQEEINKFNRFTPAQKVIWIQQHFKDDAGIFEFLFTNTYNKNEYNKYGYSSHTIKFNDQIDNIEELFNHFDKAFFNKNPLVRLAAIDLVKYAFVVEGFKFKKGSISKIITNKSMYGNINDKGMEIIPVIVEAMNSHLNMLQAQTEDFIDKFVRNHSEIVKLVKLKAKSSIKSDFNYCATLNTRGLVYIPYIPQYKNLLESITLGPNDTKNYIRIGTTINKQPVIILYKIKNTKNGVYLIPLNTLERNETDEVSVNNQNNKFPLPAFYNKIVQYATNEGVTDLTIYKEAGSDAYKFIREQQEYFTIKSKRFENVNELVANTKYIQSLHNNKDIYVRDSAIKFTNDVNAILNSNPLPGKINILYNPNPIIGNLLAVGQSTIQDFPTGGVSRLVKITRIDNKNYSKKLSTEIVNEINRNADKFPKLYKIEPIIDNEVKNNYLQQVNDQRNEDIARYAITSPISEINLNNEYNYTEIDQVSKNIVENINYRHRTGKDSDASTIVRKLTVMGIEFDSGKSMDIHKKDIYELASDYYRKRAIELINKINNFETSTGEKFKLNDPNLYKYLKDNPEDYFDIVNIILEAKTFGDVFNDIFRLDISSEDPLTRRHIENIRKAIKDVRDNTVLIGKGGAIDLLFNDFIANSFATNPMIRNGFIQLTTQFGDIDWLNLQFSDIGEINHKQVQTMVKLVYGILNEASVVLAPKAVAKFNKSYDEIMQMTGTYNEDNFITPDGRLIQSYNDNFLIDRTDLYEKLFDAKNIYGEYSKEHFEAKLERDRWRLEHTHQELVDDYYRTKLNIEEQTYKKAGSDFLEYLKLRKQLYSLGKDFNTLTEKEKEEHNNLLAKIEMLKSDLYGPMGSEEMKDDEGLRKASAIRDYENRMRELNKEYFEYDERLGFRDNLKYFLKIIENYEKANPHETLDMRLKDSSYREAYDWIKSNSRYVLDEDTQKIINDAFKAFMPNTHKPDNRVKSILDGKNAYDPYGNIDARKLSSEDIAKIKEAYETDYLSNYRTTIEKVNLIKSVPKDLPVYKETFYNKLRHPSEFTPEVQKRRNEIVKRINKLIANSFDDYGDISTRLLFKNLTIDELNELADLYKELKDIRSTREKDKDYGRKIHKMIDNNEVSFVINEAAYNKNRADFNDLNNTQKAIWEKIFLDEIKNYSPNDDIFGYIEASNEYIDSDRTTAKDIIENNVISVPTEYYYDMREQMAFKGKEEFDKWYEQNHIFNTKTRKWEPLKIWTRTEINPAGTLKGTYSYLPNFENQNRKIAEGKENKSYVAYTVNYKPKYDEKGNITDKYHNENYTKLSDKEKKMLELFRATMNFYAIDNDQASHTMKSFAKRGYLPRRATYSPDAKWYMAQALGSLGLEVRQTGETEWTDHMDYSHNRDIDFDMLKTLKGKGFKEETPILERGTDESPEEYKERVTKQREDNKKIKEENTRLEKEILDRDWKGVMNDFISKAIEYNAREKAKNSIYLLLEDLKSNDVYKLSNFNKVPIKNSKSSVKEQTMYETVPQTNTVELVENWMRRIIYGQFKKTQKFTKYADLMQNMTSAKYMIFNVTGGIANIGTGTANIFNEVFAKQYFNSNDWFNAQKEYFGNITSIIADMYKPTSMNETAAILKQFNIVNFDAFTERRNNESASEYVRRVRDGLYSMQSGGEHYMQNTAMLAMMNSYRIFDDVDGETRLGSFNQYIWRIEIDTMKDLLKDNETLYKDYENFIRTQNADLKTLQKYDSFNQDYNADFLRKFGNRDLIEKYITKRKEAVKNAKSTFKTLPKLREQLILNSDGVVDIKPDSKLTTEMIAQFKANVESVNKLIHGVYDKIGAAKIEAEWWGGLVMQYHKHIYPGIMKRWRRKGMYNEIRGSIEKGSYVALGNYLSTEFKGIGKRIKNRRENKENIALASIQEIIKASIDTILNLKLNYQLMPIWEQNTMKRSLGDLLGVASAFLLAISIHLMTDDDEIQDNDFFATMLYMADRLNSEAQMYTPWGLWTEASTLWSSPIAAQNGPKDLLKGLSIGIRALYDDDFDMTYTTGLYKGQNKLSVLLYRNTPIYRVYQRLSNMDKNNSYYRINETAFNIKAAKTIADTINPD